MVKFGRNMKVTLGTSQREAFTTMMTEAFGSTWVDATPEMRIFTMPDGFSLGAQTVADSDALDADAMFIAPWVEFLVEDIAATTETLERIGATSFEYVDQTHTYFRAPGGLVFRLATID